MKKILLFFYGLAFMSCAFESHSQSKAQSFLAEDVKDANYVVEGKIIDKTYFKSGSPFGIFTSTVVHVTKVFKGEIADTLIELVYGGGVMTDTLPNGKTRQIGDMTTEGFSIGIGEEGVFLLTNNDEIKKQLHSELKSYSPRQSWVSFIRYSPSKKKDGYYFAAAFEHRYDDVEKDLFQTIESATKQPRKILGLNSFEQAEKIHKE